MLRRGFGIAVVTAVLALGLPLGVVAARDSNGDGRDGENHGGDGKITVCHKPQGGGAPVTISISKKAWKAHKAHGDTEGKCPSAPKPAKPAQGTCTFDAATSVYNTGATSTSPLYATGPIRFAWTVATGVVTVPGGFWNELYPPPPAVGTTFPFTITAGTVSTANAVSLSLLRTSDNTHLAFTGQLSGSTLTGLMSGNYFAATGRVRCGGDDEDDDD